MNDTTRSGGPMVTAYLTLEAELAEARARSERLVKALEEIRDLFDGEADASCEPGDDRFRPNRAMEVDMIIDAALAKNPNPVGQDLAEDSGLQLLEPSGPVGLGPDDWPSCWLFAIRSEVAVQGTEAKTPAYNLGERTTINRNGMLTYHCSCGSSFDRMPGDLVDEARAWVVEHAPHVENNPVPV